MQLAVKITLPNFAEIFRIKGNSPDDPTIVEISAASNRNILLHEHEGF